MSNMDSTAEQIKLERLLGTDNNQLVFVAEQDWQATRDFRETLSEFFYHRHQDAFHRLAGLSKLLPLKVSAKLATGIMGPVLAAGIAGELAPEKAAKLADRLPTDFLAKLSLYLEPKRALAIIAAVNEDHIVAVADCLSEQQEYVTLARFVTAISESALRRIIDNAEDDGYGLLRTGMYVEDKSLIDSLLRQLSDSQKVALMAAATEYDLWPEMLSLLVHLKPDMQLVMANLAGEQPAEVRERLMQQVAESGDWSALLTAMGAMNEDNLKRCVDLAAMHDKTLLTQFNQAVATHGMEKPLAPLYNILSDEQKALID